MKRVSLIGVRLLIRWYRFTWSHHRSTTFSVKRDNAIACRFNGALSIIDVVGDEHYCDTMGTGFDVRKVTT